jgi:hypothetical protein
MNGEPEEKQFGMKPIEQRMLLVLQEQYFSVLSNFLSFIALERLAYPVTEKTKFRVEGDKLYVHEEQEQPDQAPEVSTGDAPTSEAIGAK